MQSKSVEDQGAVRWIAHRGNLDGPCPGRENTRAYLEQAIAAGFDVECDVLLQGGEFWFGHDHPDEQVTLDFLTRDEVWCHAKSVEAFALLLAVGARCFFQAHDAVALTSCGKLWTHSACRDLTSRSIATVIEFDAARIDELRDVAGICSDRILAWREAFAGVGSHA